MASARPTSPSPPRPTRSRRWAALGAAGRAAHLHRLADLIDANVERLAAVECVDMAMLLRSLKRAGDRTAARGTSALRRPRGRVRGARVGVERHREPRRPDAERARRRDHARGTRRSCSRPGRPRRRSPPAARSSSSRPSGRRCRARCSAISSPRPASRPACSTSCRGSARRSGAALVAHPGVRRISFTGSPETARADRRRRGAEHRPVHRRARRQGAARSSSPTAISRPPRARRRASTTTPARSASPARACSCEERVADAFLELFHRFTDEHVLGDPRDDATTVSPLIHPEHLARVEGFVERARANGDEIVRGGRRREDVGPLFYEPTLVVPRSND